MASYTLSLFLWIGYYNFTQQAMEFQKQVFGWLEDATFFPANQQQQQVYQEHDLCSVELTFPEDRKAKEQDSSLFDIPNVSDILDDNDWMDEKIDLSILDSTFQDCLAPASDIAKPGSFDVATVLDSLVDNYFQSGILLPFETSIPVSPDHTSDDCFDSTPSTSGLFISEATPPSPISILPEIGLQLPKSPAVDFSWSASSSPSGSSQSESCISDGLTGSEQEMDPPSIGAFYVEITTEDDGGDNLSSSTDLGKMPSVHKLCKVKAQPYSVSVHQVKKAARRERKKVQNKEAAARYRVKKRVNDKVLGDEVEGLEKEQEALQEKHDALQMEVKYLKALTREMFKARGLLK